MTVKMTPKQFINRFYNTFGLSKLDPLYQSVMDLKPISELFLTDFYRPSIILLVGSGGQGKTHLLKYLCDCSSYPSYSIDSSLFNKVDKSDFFVPTSCNIVIDDAALFINSRRSSKKFNTDMMDYLTILRHKDNIVIVTIQNTRMLDIAFFESHGCIILQKLYKSKLNIEHEREENRDRINNGNGMLWDYAKEYGEDIRNLVYDHSHNVVCRYSMASLTIEQSKVFKEWKPEEVKK